MWSLIREEVDSVRAVCLAYAPNPSTSLPARSKLVCDGIGEIGFLRLAWGRAVGSIFQSRSLPQPEDRRLEEFSRSLPPPNRTKGQTGGRRRHSLGNGSGAALPAP